MIIFLFKILNKLNLLGFLNLSVKKRFNSVNFNLPILAKMGLTNYYMSELWMIHLLKQLLPIVGGSFMDVGVNVGHTFIKLKSIDWERAYIGFEPNVHCNHYLEKLQAENNLKNVKIIPCGISEETSIGVINFYHQGATDTTASIVADFRPDQKVVKRSYVPIFNHEIVSNIIEGEKIGLLKIDVEGAELEVLLSFENLIARESPFILIEILPVYKLRNVNRIQKQEKIQEILRRREYDIFRIYKQEGKLISIELIDEIGVHSKLDWCDYLCVPSRRTEDVIQLFNSN